VQYPGAFYHVMNRGDRREPIFKDDQDRERFLATLGEACAKTSWQVHAFCLMPNHFHLVVETPQANLVAGMKWFLGEWRVPADNAAGRRGFALEMEARRQGTADEEFKPVRRGWCLGGETFRGELLEQIAVQRGVHHYGEELVESAEARALRVIEDALRKRGWTREELKARRKGDPFKVRLAAQVRMQTTVTAAWIAEQLHMGTRGHLTHLLYRHGRSG